MDLPSFKQDCSQEGLVLILASCSLIRCSLPSLFTKCVYHITDPPPHFTHLASTALLTGPKLASSAS